MSQKTRFPIHPIIYSKTHQMRWWNQTNTNMFPLTGSHGIELSRDWTTFLKIGFVFARGAFYSYYNLQISKLNLIWKVIIPKFQIKRVHKLKHQLARWYKSAQGKNVAYFYTKKKIHLYILVFLLCEIFLDLDF